MNISASYARFFAAGLLVATCLAAPALAAPKEKPVAVTGASGIAAVVNDEVVSTLDLENRVQMVLATTRLSDTPEVRERLRPQILRALLDETLQMQEATRAGIEIRQDDLDAAVATLEQQRGMPAGMLLAKLDELGVPRGTFLEQIRAQLAWTKLVLRKLKPQVRVTDEEVDRERSRIKRTGTGNEVEIEVLALPVDRPENDAQVRELAAKLAAEMRAGAPFESVARELGGSGKTAIQEIKPFWVQLDQLDPGLSHALAEAVPGAITEPVRTPEGYTLVKLINRRGGEAPDAGVAEIVFKDILLKLKNEAGEDEVQTMLGIGREIAKSPGTCSEPSVAGVKNLGDYDIEVSFRRELKDSLPEQMRAMLDKLSVGGVSEPVATAEGIRLFMLCERVEKPAPMADRDEAYSRLFNRKLELEAQKYLRTIRREATVDIRLQAPG